MVPAPFSHIKPGDNGLALLQTDIVSIADALTGLGNADIFHAACNGDLQ